MFCSNPKQKSDVRKNSSDFLSYLFIYMPSESKPSKNNTNKGNHLR